SGWERDDSHLFTKSAKVYAYAPRRGRAGVGMGEGSSLTEDNGMVYNLLERENCRQTLRFAPPGGAGARGMTPKKDELFPPMVNG
ncbi:MAG: hypothetical protein D6681_08650, partial [Calditrichaeota bacterium]